MLEAIVNQRTVAVDIDNRSLSINGESRMLDILPIQNGKYFHLQYKDHSYFFEILSFDKAAKTYKIGFNGLSYEVGIRDRFDQLLHSMGLDSVSKPKVNDVKAPMPGLVLTIKVSEGQEIKKGDPILILEAMKMENIIKSPVDGVVKSIVVAEKQAVDKNQPLITFN
jgi:acetyl/propionyl-CoA carboxylase alpha subunit